MRTWMDGRHALALLLVILCGCLIPWRSESAGHNPPGTQKPMSVIPFQLDGHEISVNVKINNAPKEYTFLLDTGALTMIDERAAAELRLEKGAAMPTLDPSVKTYFTTLNELSVGEMIVKNITIPIMNAKSFFGESFEMDGFIGSDFLKRFRLTIDYRRKIIIPYDTVPDSLWKGYRIPFDRHIMIGAPLVECVIHDTINTKGMIDTGSPFGLVLPLPFAETMNNSPMIRSKGIIVKWPFTSSEYNYLSRLERLTLGSLELRNVPVLFAELPANVSNPLLGKEILSEFRITLNYPENELILSPYEDAHFRDNVYSTGLAVKKDKNDTVVVRGFWSGSPADRSNISVGDEILEINSKQTRNLPIEEIDGILHDDSISEITLVVRSKETEREVIFKKEMLLPNVPD